ncbi:Nucleoporin nup85, partial [Lobosporangium transversale]
KYLDDTEVSLLNRIKIAVLEMDAIKTLRHCGSYHPWLVAHLADILQQYGYLNIGDLQLQDITAEFELDVRDFFVISYAQSLMSNTGLWEVVAGYLLRCGHTGRAMLSEWICHVPLQTPSHANKVLKFCEDNELSDALRSINRVIGVEEAKRGEYILAIQHFIASCDDDRVAKVVDELMQRYLKSGQFDLEDTLISLSDRTSNRHVDFFRLYVQFHQEYKNGNLMNAGRILRKLLTMGKASIRYWAAILFDALPLLENKQRVIFDSSDTYELMWCLEEIVGSQHKAEYLKRLPANIASEGSTVEEREKQLNIIRLSLVRNLARSLVHPPNSADQ